MIKISKKYIIQTGLLLLLLNSQAFAKELNSYQQVHDALMSGKNVLVNLDVEKCAVQSNEGNSIKHIAFKLTSLYEFETGLRPDGKKMLALGGQESGLFSNKQAVTWFRNLRLIYEDGTIIDTDDIVDPASFTIKARTQISCQLKADKSGGATAIEI